MADTHISDFMTRTVACVTQQATVREVAEQMRDARLSCVVVVDGRKPLGIVTERDLTAVCARLLAGERVESVSQIMTPNVICMNRHATCAEAVSLTRSRCIRRLVIVEDNGNLAGLITQTDLLRAHTEEVERQKATLEDRVAQRTAELKQANIKLESLARIDPLLRIGNRRAMDDSLEKLCQRAQRYQRPYSVALLDVDYFKKYNDHYGHQDGDGALIAVADATRAAVRTADEVYRYGGEELLLIFPEVGIDGAQIAGEHVRSAIEALALPHQGAPNGLLTVSIGLAAENLESPNVVATISRADQALYRAKQLGRNQIACASDEADEEAA